MSVDERPLVARRIEEIRKLKRVSRRQLADRCGTDHGDDEAPRWTRLRVWRLETGEIEISAKDVLVISTALGEPVDSFYREAEAA